ncbi:hypothetical protein MLD38_018262 [Melastoma candidum]|uniref:Uncharacterized protein n=1 Tax=Melastoma candidum TaxID=119954 RepID=A0ACB9QTC4_9MYRT|nr:hypothetical protein MLD38_018262 [Melastoma candidum]
MEDDWDLHAVVRRGCCSAPSSFRGADVGGFPLKDEVLAGAHPQVFSSEWTRKDYGGELHELCKPFFSTRPSLPLVLQNSCSERLPWLEQPRHGDSAVKSSDDKIECTDRGFSGPCLAAKPRPSRSKRRKNQMKKVCHVPAESLTSGIWAWRKYGQKPIKGSPYPRGYYRCSSSKGCPARKQVERDKTEPGMFIVTYTAEHNHPAPTHRNSLAGSTRQKPATTRDDVSNNDMESKTPISAIQPCLPTPSPANTSSPEEEAAPRTSMNTESPADDEDEGDVGLSGMVISDDDDFSFGLEGRPLGDEDDYEDSFFDQFPANFGRVSWSSNNTAAAGSRS